MSTKGVPITTAQGPAPRGAIPRGLNALTIDVEEWFHAHNLAIPTADWARWPSRLEEPIGRLRALLTRFDTKATFFVLGWVAERAPDLIRAIADDGHEIACHGYDHRPVTELTPDEFHDDLARARRALEALVNSPVIGYRAPSYSIGHANRWAFDVLVAQGFRYDSSIYPAASPHGRYGVPDAPQVPFSPRPGLWEFPLPTLQLLGRRVPALTGAYLRLSPPSVIRAAFHQNLRRSIPVVVNVHPWELDPHQPRVTAPWRKRLLHYANLRSTEEKIARLLNEFRFTTLASLRELCDPAPVTKPRKQVLPTFVPPLPETVTAAT